MDNKKHETFDEYMAKKHPALQATSNVDYVTVQTKVSDKYGIVELASDLLVAMNFADAEAVDSDPKEAVDMSANVSDLWAQFTLAIEDLAKDMGTEATFNLSPTPAKTIEITDNYDLLNRVETLLTYASKEDADADTVSAWVEELTDNLDEFAKSFSDDNNTIDFSDAGVVYRPENGYKAEYQLNGLVSYLIALVDAKGNWYTFSKVNGLAKVTDDERRAIELNSDYFETMNDKNSDVVAAILTADSSAVAHEELVVLHDYSGHAYKFNKYMGLVAMPDSDITYPTTFNKRLI